MLQTGQLDLNFVMRCWSPYVLDKRELVGDLVFSYIPMILFEDVHLTSFRLACATNDT